MKIIILGPDIPHNHSKITYCQSKGYEVKIKSPSDTDYEDCDIIWNCAKYNTLETINKYNPKVIINNNTQTMHICDDKWLSYKYCYETNIPQVKTSLENEYGYPCVMKYTYGSFGSQVFLVNNEQEEANIILLLNTEIQRAILRGQPYGKIIYQPFVKESAGKDICAYVVYGQVVACMKRENTKDFRSHIFRGGVGSIYELTEEQKQLCLDIAKCVQLDCISINFLKVENNLMVCEINVSPGMDEIQKVTGVNIIETVLNNAIARMDK